MESNTNKEYLPIDGHEGFYTEAAKLMFTSSYEENKKKVSLGSEQ